MFGELPAGAASTNVVRDVGAEICRDHLFDPSRVDAKLPEGYRFILASEYAREDSGVAELLRRQPKYSAYGVGSLCFMSVGSFEADSLRMHSAEPTPMAFWWARAEGPRDPRMKGKVEWVQLASWYSRDITLRSQVQATDPTARFVDIQVNPVEPRLWRMRLVLPDESIEAEVRGDGERKKRKAPEPGFMSVPFAGQAAGSFWVITYFGHHHQGAEGRWRARGHGVFQDSFRIPGEAAVFRTAFQDGWSALSGLYRSEP